MTTSASPEGTGPFTVFAGYTMGTQGVSTPPRRRNAAAISLAPPIKNASLKRGAVWAPASAPDDASAGRPFADRRRSAYPDPIEGLDHDACRQRRLSRSSVRDPFSYSSRRAAVAGAGRRFRHLEAPERRRLAFSLRRRNARHRRKHLFRRGFWNPSGKIVLLQEV